MVSTVNLRLYFIIVIAFDCFMLCLLPTVVELIIFLVPEFAVFYLSPPPRFSKQSEIVPDLWEKTKLIPPLVSITLRHMCHHIKMPHVLKI